MYLTMSAYVKSIVRTSPTTFDLVLFDKVNGEYPMPGFAFRSAELADEASGRIGGLRAKSVYMLRNDVCRASDGR